MAVVKYQCKNCGDSLNFDAEKGLLSCPSCMSEFDVAEFKKEKSAKKSKKKKAKDEESYEISPLSENSSLTYDSNIEEEGELSTFEDDKDEIEEHTSVSSYDEDVAREYLCENCGAALVTECNTAATICAFCQSPMILSNRLSGQYAPVKALPFKMDIKSAHEKFKKWCMNGIVTPNDFRMLERVKDIQGIYIPFWLFDLDVKAWGHATCTKVRTSRSGDTITTYTDHYDVQRNVVGAYNKLPADASIKMPDEFMDKLEPFHYEELKDFDMAYLTGFGAHKYDYTDKDLLPRIHERVDEYMRSYIRENIKGFATVNLHKVDSKIAQKDAVYTLLPIYLMNYTYKSKVYTFVMNGQTGKVAGAPPISKIKLALIFMLTSAVPFALLAYIFSIEGVEEAIVEHGMTILYILINLLLMLAEMN